MLKRKHVSLHIDLTVQGQSAALTNSRSVDRGLHTLHDTDSTKREYCIKHQKRVRNCFKPKHSFPSLHFCLGLPTFPTKGNGVVCSYIVPYARDGCRLPLTFHICCLGMVQKQGCSSPQDVHYFGFSRAVRLTDWEGGGGKSPTIHY